MRGNEESRMNARYQLQHIEEVLLPARLRQPRRPDHRFHRRPHRRQLPQRPPAWGNSLDRTTTAYKRVARPLPRLIRMHTALDRPQRIPFSSKEISMQRQMTESGTRSAPFHWSPRLGIVGMAVGALIAGCGGSGGSSNVPFIPRCRRNRNRNRSPRRNPRSNRNRKPPRRRCPTRS